MSSSPGFAGSRALKLVFVTLFAPCLALGLLCALAWLQPAPVQAAGATIVVAPNTNFPCTNAGIQAAINAASAGDTILFYCGPVNIPISTTLLITKDLTFQNVSYNMITMTVNYNVITTTMLRCTLDWVLVGSQFTPVFSITSGIVMTLSGVVLRGQTGGLLADEPREAQASGPGGVVYVGVGSKLVSLQSALCGGFASGGGGNIYAAARSTVFLEASAVSGGQAFNGGNIYCSGCAQVSIENSSVSDGIAGNNGGGIYISGTFTAAAALIAGSPVAALGASPGTVYAPSVIISNTTILRNSAARGAGIYNTAALTVTAASILSNTASQSGGGIDNEGGAVRLTNSTLALNRAVNSGGGALDNGSGGVTLTNSTLVSNTALSGGGLRLISGELAILNSLVAFNTPANCSGGVTSLGHNLEQAHSCAPVASGDISNTNPLLGPLADNGGATLTYALLPGSPAIDKGSSTGCPADDQRGAARPFNVTCDIGAYEFGAKIAQAINFPPVGDRSLSESPVTLGAFASSGLPVTYTVSGQCGVSGSQVTLTAIGSCTGIAHQAGNGNYVAAPAVTQTFNIVYKLFLPLVLR